VAEAARSLAIATSCWTAARPSTTGRAFGNFNGEKSYFTRGSNYDLKGNRQVCATAVGMTQNLLLADRSHMDLIAEAIHKIHTHSAVLART